MDWLPKIERIAPASGPPHEDCQIRSIRQVEWRSSYARESGRFVSRSSELEQTKETQPRPSQLMARSSESGPERAELRSRELATAPAQLRPQFRTMSPTA